MLEALEYGIEGMGIEESSGDEQGELNEMVENEGHESSHGSSDNDAFSGHLGAS